MSLSEARAFPHSVKAHIISSPPRQIPHRPTMEVLSFMVESSYVTSGLKVNAEQVSLGTFAEGSPALVNPWLSQV